eukprot:SAG22_NODE_101_length_20519_cov_15.588002_13_plen_46_part_00
MLETSDAGDNILGTYSSETVEMMTEIIEMLRADGGGGGGSYKHVT